MLEEMISGSNIRDTLNSLLSELHSAGPVNNLALEKLAYAKKFHPETFKEFESRVIALMGLFYKVNEPSSFLEKVYEIFAQSIADHTGHWFSPTQASAFRSIKHAKYFSFSAPTSAGKSHLFRSLILDAKGDIVIVVPSRALIAEYHSLVTNILKNKNEVLVLQFIDNVNTASTERRVFIITPERGVELFKNANELSIELFLLDEAHISESPDRGIVFDSFIRRIEAYFPNAKKVFAHPFVANPDAQLKKHAIRSDAKSRVYRQQSVGKIFLSYHGKKFRHFSPNTECPSVECAADPIANILRNSGSVLIYISKKKIYEGLHLTDFAPYISLCPEIEGEEPLKLINKLKAFIGAGEDNTDKRSELVEMMKRGIVVHHGSIPLKGRLLIEDFVRAGFARICFATSTLNQGINMPFDAVWIDNFTGMQPLELKNLIGRSGRSTRESKFDFGYTVIKQANVATFTTRFNQGFSISERSSLDNNILDVDEDSRDLVEALSDDKFNDMLHMPQSQVDRLSSPRIDGDVLYILDNFMDNGVPIQGAKYVAMSDALKDKIKACFRNIFVTHMRRNDLTAAEASVLSTALPILLWNIQGRSFSQVVSLRHSYLSQKDERRKIQSRRRRGEVSNETAANQIRDLTVRYSQVPTSIPNRSLARRSSFGRQLVRELNFDHVVFDTYDYLDKVIALSLVDPLCAAFELYFAKTGDSRARALSNYIRYRTDDPIEILLLRYGFVFEDIEWIKKYVEAIDATKISFKRSIAELSEDQIAVIERYL